MAEKNYCANKGFAPTHNEPLTEAEAQLLAEDAAYFEMLEIEAEEEEKYHRDMQAHWDELGAQKDAYFADKY